MGTDVTEQRDRVVAKLNKQPVGTDLLYIMHGELYRKRSNDTWCHVASNTTFPPLAFWSTEGTWVLL